MEPMIAVLAPHVIDQIAAGEVIERPASVVKELVENAIDAGATTITIEVGGGGRSLVRVSDDGCGMSAKSAVLALERHATSKLREVDDLWGITSMGFRGEALPSIASVSKMTLTTRRADDDAGTRIVVEAGRLISVSDAGVPVGTTVLVTDLLYNLPARLKFLKGEATEASHVTELVAKIAMAYPRLHVRLKHNGRTALDVPPDRDGFARAQALLGPRIAARMIPVTGEESGVRVTAYLGAPELAQATSRGVQLFVGRRPVRDRGLLHALAMGYGELVPRGRHPVAIVLVDVPAGAVDVNVHPQKLEVRFSDAAVVASAVRHVVQAGVNSARWRDEAGGAGPVQMIASVAPPVLPFDGHGATRLAERHVAEMKSRQVPLGFTSPPAQPSASAPPSSPSSPSRMSGTGGMAGKSSPAGSAGGASSAGTARDWVRNLRDQTRAARAEDSRSAPGIAGGESPPELARSGHSALGGPSESPGGDGAPGGGPRSYPSIPSLLEQLDPPLRAGEPPLPLVTPSPPAASARSAAAGSARSAASASSTSAPLFASALLSAPTPVSAYTPSALSAPLFASALLSASPGLSASPTLAAPARAAPPDSFPSPSEAIRPSEDLGDPRGAVSDFPLADGSGAIAMHGYFSQLRYLGQLDLTYLVCEGDGEIVLVDQHAAHERVELARLRERHTHGAGDARVAVQNMLFPVTLDATPAQLELVARVGDLLSQVGFEVEPFGKATLAVKAVPAGIRHGDPAQLLRMLLQDWAEAGAPSEAERLDALLGEIACHSVVRAGDRLTPSEAENLLRSLDGIDPSLPARHGRAVLLRLPLTEIGRRFGR